MAREFRHVDEAEQAPENLSPLQRAQQAAADAEAEAAESQAFYLWFKKHPELDANEANISVMRHWIGEGVNISLGLLEDAYKVMLDQEPKHFPLSRRTAGMDEREREEIVQRIIDLKNVSGNGDTAWEGNERARLNLRNPTNQQYTKSLDELRAILEDVELRAKFSKMTTAELRAIVKPPEPAAEILPSKFSAPILRAMAPGALRQLIGRYGIAALNSRLAGEN